MVPQYDSSEFHLEKLQNKRIVADVTQKKETSDNSMYQSEHINCHNKHSEYEYNNDIIQSKALSDLSLFNITLYCITNNKSFYLFITIIMLSSMLPAMPISILLPTTLTPSLVVVFSPLPKWVDKESHR